MFRIRTQDVEEKGIRECAILLFKIGHPQEQVDFDDGIGVVDALDIFVDGLENLDDGGVAPTDVGVFGSHEGVGIGERFVATGFIRGCGMGVMSSGLLGLETERRDAEGRSGHGLDHPF